MTMKLFTMSFDDGTVQDRHLVALMNRYGVRSTFNLNSGLFSGKCHINHEGVWVRHDKIDAAEVNALYAGHEIASHTVTHPCLLNCTTDEVIRQTKDDCEALKKLCGYEMSGMAYPGGSFFSDGIIRTILDNTPIRYARTVDSAFDFAPPADFMIWNPTCYCHPSQFDRMNALADRFIADKSGDDLLFYVWGHAFELDKFGMWDDLERFFDKIGGREDIRYVTNREAMAYITAARASE